MTIETQTIERLKALYDAWMDAEGSAARVTAVIPLERAAIDALPTLFANAERQAEMIAALTGQAKNAEIEMERLRGEAERLRAYANVMEGEVSDLETLDIHVERKRLEDEIGRLEEENARLLRCAEIAEENEANVVSASLALPAPAQAEPVAWERERKMHVVNLEQCSIFVDSDPIKRAMTDAAAFLRAAPPPPAGEG